MAVLMNLLTNATASDGTKPYPNIADAAAAVARLMIENKFDAVENALASVFISDPAITRDGLKTAAADIVSKI